MTIRVKAELLDTTNQLRALKKSLNKLEQYLTRDCLEVQGIPKSSSDTREDINEIVVELGQRETNKGFKFLWTNGDNILISKDQREGSNVIQITNAKALRKIGKEMSYAQIIIPP